MKTAAQVEVTRDLSLVGAQMGAEIDRQIATAKQYPRDITKAVKASREMATMSRAVAERCEYSVPRAGKQIKGPSVRLAEIIAANWGNLRFGARVVDEERDFVTCQAICHDLESNVSYSVEVRRRITDRDGRRYNADMIETTGRAACAIAMRNAIFKVLPRAVWDEVYQAAKEAMRAASRKEPISERRHRALGWFASQGLPEEAILRLLKRKGPQEIREDDLETLNGWRTALDEGTISVESLLQEAGFVEKPKKKGGLPKMRPAPRGAKAKEEEKAETAGQPEPGAESDLRAEIVEEIRARLGKLSQEKRKTAERELQFSLDEPVAIEDLEGYVEFLRGL